MVFDVFRYKDTTWCLMFLGIRIQRGEHNSVEDAQVTMKLFRRVQVEWEKELLSDVTLSKRQRLLSENSSFLSDSFWPADLHLA